MSDHGVFGWLRFWRRRRPVTPRGGIQIRVELHEDDPGWVFRVPSLNIVGGAPTQQAALERCMEAIRFSLETPVDGCPTATQQLYVAAELTPPRSPALA